MAYRVIQVSKWIVRDWELADDDTRWKAQCREAVKEYNTNGDIELDPQDWERKVGFWVD